MRYNLELDKETEKIKEEKAKSVCVQLPFGLRNQAVKIASYLEEKTGADIFIWLGSCFGACDIPSLDVDILIHWGHSKPGLLE